MFVMFPFIVLYMNILGRNARTRRRNSTARSKCSRTTSSTRCAAVDTLKLFGAGKRHERIFDVSERFREATMKRCAQPRFSSLVLDLFSTLSIAAVASCWA
ncbi:MAG: hypothetical protein ACLSVD_15090 [Eggerthellaceae bacterium]